MDSGADPTAGGPDGQSTEEVDPDNLRFVRNEIASYDDSMFNGEKIDFRRVKYVPFADLKPHEMNF